MGWNGILSGDGPVALTLPSRAMSRSMPVAPTAVPVPASTRRSPVESSIDLAAARMKPQSRNIWIGLALAILLICSAMATRLGWPMARSHLTSPAGQAFAEPDAEPIIVSAASTAPVASATDGEQAAPSAGVTGTTALPAMPVPPETAAAQLAAAQATAVANPLSDGTIHPAQPFSMAAATLADRGRASQCLTTAIYYEAATEPDAGQQAVAQVILNRVRHPAFPDTVCGVVYQGSERSGCQFSFACDGSMARIPSRAYWARAAAVASAALNGRVFAPVGLATHYHTYAVTPAWNRSLVMTAAIGAHFFHRWQGWWGTPAAFRDVYRGGEPVPGPHPRLTPPPSPVAPVPMIVASAAPMTVPPTPQQAMQPQFAGSGEPLDQAAPTAPRRPPGRDSGSAGGNSGTAEDQILPQWRNSGRPIGD